MELHKRESQQLGCFAELTIDIMNVVYEVETGKSTAIASLTFQTVSSCGL